MFRCRRPIIRSALQRRKRRAYSLVEVMAAAALLAGTLAPTLAAIRAGMAQSREMATRRLLANYVVRVLEEQTALTMQNWASASVGSNFASDGHPTIRYSATKSDSVASGGIVGRLMHIQATVYEDANGNSSHDVDELSVTMRTKVSKLSTYENANH